MLTTVEAEIDDDSNVEDSNGENTSSKNSIIELLNNPEFANRKSYSAEEIETQIQEARDSWD